MPCLALESHVRFAGLNWTDQSIKFDSRLSDIEDEHFVDLAISSFLLSAISYAAIPRAHLTKSRPPRKNVQMQCFRPESTRTEIEFTGPVDFTAKCEFTDRIFRHSLIVIEISVSRIRDFGRADEARIENSTTLDGKRIGPRNRWS
jgi:hypothetical protein